MNRWHIVDNVPFQTSFEACIEKYFSNDRPTQYACVAYWYQAAGQTDPYEPVPVDQRVAFYKELTYPLEMADIKILEKPIGAVEAQGMRGFKTGRWQNHEQLWWTGELGSKLKLGVTAKQDGEYKILTRLTKAPDYGIVQFYIDDEKLGKPIDLFNPDTVIATEELDLGSAKLSAGEHVVTVEIIGTNPEAIASYMVGIDYLKLKQL